MNKILEYIKQVGCFTPPQYLGGYDNIPFTHKEYINYAYSLWRELKSFSKDFTDPGDEDLAPITIRVVPFSNEEGEFVLRFCAMGEEVLQLLTRNYYDANFSDEPLD